LNVSSFESFLVFLCQNIFVGENAEVEIRRASATLKGGNRAKYAWLIRLFFLALKPKT
jgi:hypothetical protein